MLAMVQSGCLVGIRSEPVQIEAQINRGLPCFEVVGLPERCVRESRVRVRAALGAMGFSLPPRSLVLNLAPGDLRKTGSTFDLPMAIAVLAACGALENASLEECLVVGELSLSGELRPMPGAVSHLRAAHARGLRRAIVPDSVLSAARFVPELDVLGFSHLKDVVDWLLGKAPPPRPRRSDEATALPVSPPDLADVSGQLSVKRALEVAAAGGHHLLMLGPPGSGKTMLARRLPGLLPQPTIQEAVEIATISAASGLPIPSCPEATRRPFRAPHHSASASALVGGGDPVRPGELTLAHGGVLFLDELTEFRRDAIESLRVTMESGSAVIARARYRVEMPAAPQIVAAMNPCPCGHQGDPTKPCVCGPEQIARYRARISGPLLDRFDLHIVVPRVPPRALRQAARGESSAQVGARVAAAKARLLELPAANGLGALSARVAPDGLSLLEKAVDKLGLSARGYAKALRVARTIAALEDTDDVSAPHIAEAIQYRCLDRASAA